MGAFQPRRPTTNHASEILELHKRSPGVYIISSLSLAVVVVVAETGQSVFIVVVKEKPRVGLRASGVRTRAGIFLRRKGVSEKRDDASRPRPPVMLCFDETTAADGTGASDE